MQKKKKPNITMVHNTYSIESFNSVTNAYKVMKQQ